MRAVVMAGERDIYRKRLSPEVITTGSGATGSGGNRKWVTPERIAASCTISDGSTGPLK